MFGQVRVSSEGSNVGHGFEIIHTIAAGNKKAKLEAWVRLTLFSCLRTYFVKTDG